MAAPRAHVCAERLIFIGRPRDVGVDLHHERVLLGDAAAVDHFLDLDAVLLEAVDDRQRPEGGGLDQRAVDLRRAWCAASGRPAGRSAADRPGSCGCRCSSRAPAGRFRPAAVCSAALVRFTCGSPWAVYSRRRQVLDEPVEDVAHRRLARLQTVHAGNDRPGHDAAQSGDVGQRVGPSARPSCRRCWCR